MNTRPENLTNQLPSRKLAVLPDSALSQFHDLRELAHENMTELYFQAHREIYGPRGLEDCRADLGFHLEFLAPVLEFGFLTPFVEYLRWLESVLAKKAISQKDLFESLDVLAAFFRGRMAEKDSAIISAAIEAAKNAARPEALGESEEDLAPKPWPEADAFETALIAGDKNEALSIMNNLLDTGKNLIDIEMHVMQPALYSIGKKWQENKITVTQEHIATAIVQALMTVGLQKSRPPALNANKVLLACVAGNQHAIGLRMVSDAFQLLGWNIKYLGANVSTPVILEQILNEKPDLVGLSVSFPQQIATVKDVIQKICASYSRGKPTVMVGGLAINQFGRLTNLIGADATWPDAASAAGNAEIPNN